MYNQKQNKINIQKNLLIKQIQIVHNYNLIKISENLISYRLKHMLKNSLKLINNFFSIQPNRAQRYFTLTLNLKQQIPLSQSLLQSHNALLKQKQTDGAILLALKSVQTSKFVYFFQSKNQIEPFEFYKKNPLTMHSIVDSYKIQQIQMKNRVRDKQLAPNYLRE